MIYLNTGISSISNFFENNIEKLISFFINNNYENIKRLITAIVIFFMFLLFRRFLTKYVFKLFKKIMDKIAPNRSLSIVNSFNRPFDVLFIVFGIFFALLALGEKYLINIYLLHKILRSVVVIIFTWGLYNLSGEFSKLSNQMQKKFGFDVDKILFPFISKCLKVVILVLALTIILAEWGINIQMLITGLGIGGLAISLAAKDTASNVIAGIILIIDKPFNIGDYIAADSSGIEGIVEDLSFRSTKIRAFTQELIIVPNSTLANSAISNFTKRGKRKCNFSISISYETSRDKMEGCIKKMEEMIKNHKYIYDEDVIISVNNLNSYSIDIGVNYFTSMINLKDYLQLKQEMTFNIMDILKSEGVEIPYPTTKVYLNN